MKKITFLVCLMTSFFVFTQTTYTFVGGTNQGDWTDPANWSGNNAPGNTIMANDTVEIIGNLLVSVFSSTTITNNGTISVSSGTSGNPTFAIFTSASLINNGTFNITNGTLSATGNIENNGTFNVQGTDFNISSGGTLTNANSFNTSGINMRVFLNEGIIVNNNGASFNFGTNTMNNNSFTNNGMITVSSGDFVNRNSLINSTSATLIIDGPGDLINDTTGTIDSSSAITINNFAQLSNNGSLTNLASGTISVINTSTLRLFGSSTITNQGEISTDSSSRIDVDENLTNDGTIINNNILDFGSQVQLVNNGLLINNSDIRSFTNPSNFVLIENSSTGTLEGINNSHSDSFMNNGTFSPGNTTDVTGNYLLNGNLVVNPSSVTNIDIESLSDFDNITAENISFNEPTPVDPFNPVTGILNVSLINSYEPAIGDSFTILANTSSFDIQGEFASVNLPTFNGKTFEIVYNNNAIVLNTVASLSTNDFSKKEFKIHPNPSDSILYVDALTNSEKATIYSQTGQLLLTQEVSPANNKIDTSTLSTGIYFLTIRNSSQKFIKL